jgi:hypothetical protein
LIVESRVLRKKPVPRGAARVTGKGETDRHINPRFVQLFETKAGGFGGRSELPRFTVK